MKALIDTDTIPEIVSIGVTTVVLEFGTGVYQSNNPHIHFTPDWVMDYIFLDESEILMIKDNQ